MSEDSVLCFQNRISELWQDHREKVVVSLDIWVFRELTVSTN